jgi:hypothetical protein
MPKKGTAACSAELFNRVAALKIRWLLLHGEHCQAAGAAHL